MIHIVKDTDNKYYLYNLCFKNNSKDNPIDVRVNSCELITYSFYYKNQNPIDFLNEVLNAGHRQVKFTETNKQLIPSFPITDLDTFRDNISLLENDGTGQTCFSLSFNINTSLGEYYKFNIDHVRLYKDTENDYHILRIFKGLISSQKLFDIPIKK